MYGIAFSFRLIGTCLCSSQNFLVEIKHIQQISRPTFGF
jgi:hypothetical protein